MVIGYFYIPWSTGTLWGLIVHVLYPRDVINRLLIFTGDIVIPRTLMISHWLPRD